MVMEMVAAAEILEWRVRRLCQCFIPIGRYAGTRQVELGTARGQSLISTGPAMEASVIVRENTKHRVVR
jgi:hypothetical protein